MIPDQECNQDQESLPLTPSTCTDPTPPSPPIPSVWIREEIVTEWREVCTQATDTKPPPTPHDQEKMLMNSRLHWCIYDYSFSMPDEKRQHKESVLSMETTQCRVHKVTNVIEAKLSEERSRWKLEIILFSVDWAEVTIAWSSTWHIEVKHMCEN